MSGSPLHGLISLMPCPLGGVFLNRTRGADLLREGDEL